MRCPVSSSVNDESGISGTFGEGFIHLMLGTDDQLYDPADGKWIVRSPGLTRVLEYYEAMTTAGVLPVEPLLNPELVAPPVMTRTVGRNAMVTMFTTFAAGQSAFSGIVVLYHSGGCGRCTGRRIIGTLRNW